MLHDSGWQQATPAEVAEYLGRRSGQLAEPPISWSKLGHMVTD